MSDLDKVLEHIENKVEWYENMKAESRIAVQGQAPRKTHDDAIWIYRCDEAATALLEVRYFIENLKVVDFEA